MRAALTAAVIALLALAGCGGDPAAAPAEVAPVLLVDRLGAVREPVEDGYRNRLTIEDGAGERVSEHEWDPIEDAAGLDVVELRAGTYRIRAEARDYFAAEHGKVEERCERQVDVEAGTEPMVWIERHWGDRCRIELDPRLCPTLGEKADGATLRQRAELALLGVPLDDAERIATAAGCHLAPAQVDGEPRPLTRQYDPSRIAVHVRDGRIQRVVGFG